MTYDAVETSALGRPVEGYEFELQGTFTRVTSAATAQTFGAVAYEPLEGLERSEIVDEAGRGAGDIEVTTPSGFVIAAAFRDTVPSALPTLTIFAKHLTDVDDQVVTTWKGVVASASRRARRATLHCMPATRRFSRQVPRAVYSAVCNHQLYDSLCKVDRLQYQFTGSVSSVDPAGTTLTIPGLRARAAEIATNLGLTQTAEELDVFWQRGVVSSQSAPGEVRGVAEANVGADPDAVRVGIPFANSVAGVEVEVSAGCDHSITTCRDKFTNFVTPGDPSSGLRHGGFAHVPLTNLFETELDRGGSAQSAPSRNIRPFGGSR